MSKEATRVIKQINLNNLPNIVTKVEVNNLKEFTSCFEKIKTACTDTVIMLLAELTKEKTLLAATYIPQRVNDQLQNWLIDSTKFVINDGTVVNDGDIMQIVYPNESESIPFKLVDVVNGTAFSILKKTGLQQEDESSEEIFDF